MSRLAVAALSVRSLAEAARHDGHDVVALDLFGDADTRAASVAWQRIGDPATLQIEREALCAGLRQAAQQGALGWLAGGGFEADPTLLAAGHAVLPLLGTPAAAVCRLRDPLQFFSALAAHGVAFPPVASQPPPGEPGWLVKNARDSGGGHVRPARDDEPPLPPFHHAQRWWPGVPMSATFVADGRAAVVLGHNRQTVCTVGPRACVFSGAVGPVAVPELARRQVARALQVLVAEFGVRGLGSLDFLLDGDEAAVLELNARPPATLALYGDCRPVELHLAACLHGRLPTPPGLALPRPPAQAVQGFRIVHATRARRAGAGLAGALADLQHGHDVPAADDAFDVGSPVCSVSAQAADAAAVLALLDARHACVHHLLETTPP